MSNNILPPVPNVLNVHDPASWALVKDWLTKVQNIINNNPPVTLGGSQGIFGFNDAVMPNSKFTAGANVIVFRNKAGAGQFLAPGPTNPATCDLSLAGPIAGGRDQAAAFTANQFIHFYFILNPSSNLMNIIASTQSEDLGPNLPAGFSHFCYIGCVPLDGSANLYKMHMGGTLFTFDTPISVLSAGVATTPTTISMASYVPPNATSTMYLLSINITNNAAASFAAYFRPTGQVAVYQLLPVAINAAGYTGVYLTMNELAPGNGRSLDYEMNAAPTSGGVYISVAGYRVPNSAS